MINYEIYYHLDNGWFILPPGQMRGVEYKFKSWVKRKYQPRRTAWLKKVRNTGPAANHCKWVKADIAEVRKDFKDCCDRLEVKITITKNYLFWMYN